MSPENTTRLLTHLTATAEWVAALRKTRKRRAIAEAEAFYRGMIAGLLAVLPSDDVMTLVNQVHRQVQD